MRHQWPRCKLTSTNKTTPWRVMSHAESRRMEKGKTGPVNSLEKGQCLLLRFRNKRNHGTRCGLAVLHPGATEKVIP